MRRKLRGVVAAVALAAAGALLLTSYVRSAADSAAAAEALVPVLVAAAPVPAGTAVAELGALVKTVHVPQDARADDAVADLAALEGRRASTAMVAGEQLLAARFLAPGQSGGGIDGDLLHVTVSLAPERALGGHVRDGDSVGVLLSFDPFSGAVGTQASNTTHLQLEKVRVVRVQGAPSTAAPDAEGTAVGTEPVPAGAFLVTLAMDAPSVEQVVFAAEHGSIWLSQQPPAAPDAGTSIITPDTAYGGSK